MDYSGLVMKLGMKNFQESKASFMTSERGGLLIVVISKQVPTEHTKCGHDY